MKRPEEEQPWALLQEVSTRWNSKYLSMASVLKSEAALRHVLNTGEFKSMKTLVRNWHLGYLNLLPTLRLVFR